MSSFEDDEPAGRQEDAGPYTEKDYTLVFCMRDDGEDRRSVLLGMKKRGFGAGKW